LSSLEGKYVRLLPLTTQDYGFVFNLEVGGPIANQFRFRGITPSPERFAELVWNGVLVQYVICWKQDASRIGTAMCYGADFRNRFARIAGALAPTAPSPYGLEGFAIFLDFLFANYDFRKVYGETLEPNLRATWSSLGSIVHEEGRRREHEFYEGEYRDLITVAIYRDEWLTLRGNGTRDRVGREHERILALSDAVNAGLPPLPAFPSSPLAERLRLVASRSKVGNFSEIPLQDDD